MDSPHSDLCKSRLLRLLFDVLSGSISPSGIRELDGDEDCITDVELAESSRQPGLKFSPDQIALLQQALQSSPWIETNEEAEYSRAVQAGNEDAALCLLVPLLTNLRVLIPPINTIRLQKVIKKIAIASQMALSSGHGLTDLPLSRLVLIFSKAYNGSDWGMPLEIMACYAALPSVRRIILNRGRDETFEQWPADLPQSRCREVYFADCTITASAVLAFAQGFRAPCAIRQSYSTYGDQFPCEEGNTWDHCLVEHGDETSFGAGRESTSIRLELRYAEQYDEVGSHGEERRNSNMSERMNQLLDGGLWDPVEA